MSQKLDRDRVGVTDAAGVKTSSGSPDALGKNHPLAKLAGSYQNDPFWDEFIQVMQDARAAEDRHLAEESSDVRP